jgi:hypothetical protein
MDKAQTNNDDLYIAGTNAHIALGERNKDIAEAYRKLEFKFSMKSISSVASDDWEDRLAFFYDDAVQYHAIHPTEPGDDEIISRLLSPEKFLWFLVTKKIRFASCSEFGDKEECVLHPDLSDHYAQLMDKLPIAPTEVTDVHGVPITHGSLTAKIGRPADSKLSDFWRQFQEAVGRQWAISCWTHRPQGVPDLSDLMTKTYGKGNYGAEIRVRYGALKRALFRSPVPPGSIDGKTYCGFVNYDMTRSYLPPFHKRPTFESENEVRFAYRCGEIEKAEFDIASIFSNMRVYPAPDAPRHHEEAIYALWEKFGGTLI